MSDLKYNTTCRRRALHFSARKERLKDAMQGKFWHGERIRILIRLQGCFEPKASAFFNFQLVLIVRNELLDFVGDREEIVPLLLVESDTKPAQPVDGNSALFTYFHTYRAGPPFLKIFIFGLEPLRFSFRSSS